MRGFLYLTLFFLWTLSAISQTKPVWNAVFQYQKIYTDKQKARIDSLNKNDAFYRQMQEDMNLNFHHKTFVMYFDNQVSKFNQKYIDKNPELAEFMNQSKKDLYLYKSFKKHKYFQNYNTLRVMFTVTDSLPDFHWKITGEKKKIGRYTVIKATGHENRTIKADGKIKDIELDLTAWFCPEIPIPNGPELYGGLPGFIMELNTGKDLFLLKEISFKPNSKISIKQPEIQDKKGTYKELLIEQDKALEAVKKHYKNRRGRQENWWQD